jgi:hypothetical protein
MTSRDKENIIKRLSQVEADLSFEKRKKKGERIFIRDLMSRRETLKNWLK